MPTPTNPFTRGDHVVAARTQGIAHGRTGVVVQVHANSIDVRWDDTGQTLVWLMQERFDLVTTAVPDHATSIARAFGC